MPRGSWAADGGAGYSCTMTAAALQPRSMSSATTLSCLRPNYPYSMWPRGLRGHPTRRPPSCRCGPCSCQIPRAAAGTGTLACCAPHQCMRCEAPSSRYSHGWAQVRLTVGASSPQSSAVMRRLAPCRNSTLPPHKVPRARQCTVQAAASGAHKCSSSAASHRTRCRNPTSGGRSKDAHMHRLCRRAARLPAAWRTKTDSRYGHICSALFLFV